MERHAGVDGVTKAWRCEAMKVRLLRPYENGVLMHVKTAALFGCAVLAAAGVGRAADVDDATQKALNANYALRCAAAYDPSDANMDAAFAVLAPDFVAIDPKGKQVTRDEVVGQGKAQMKMLHATTCDEKVESFTQSDPNTVIAVSDFHLEGDLQAPDGKHDLVITEKAQDTWKNVGGKWLAAQSKDLQVLVKIDGNVVQDQGS